MPPVLSMIIVNWNGRRYLTQCLASLERFCRYPHQVIVVDNGSTDGSVEMIRRDFPFVQLVANRTNRGYAAAVNQGLQLAAAEVVAVLNHDLEFIADPFQPLLRLLAADPSIGCIAPEILSPDRTHQASTRRFPSLADQALTLLKLRRILKATRPMRRYLADPGAGSTAPVEVDQVMGAVMIMPRTAVEKVGRFDEGYWIWFEEVDLCQRLKRAGYRVVYAPISRIVHHGGVAFDQVLSLRKQWWFLRSLFRYTVKFWPPLHAAALALLMPISYVLTVVQSLIKPR